MDIQLKEKGNQSWLQMFVDKGTGNEDAIFSDGDNVGEHTFVGRLGVPL